jgi:hypothetical protein
MTTMSVLDLIARAETALRTAPSLTLDAAEVLRLLGTTPR